MFIREPFKAPPGSKTAYEVRYRQGRKPFPTHTEAKAFADQQRNGEDGWAEINMIVSIPVEKRS